MRINLLTSFAAGIFLSTSIVGAVYFFGNNDDTKAAAVKTNAVETNGNAKLTENEMKKALVSAGYVVQKKDEFDKNIKNAAASSKTKDSAANNSNSSQKVVYRTTINVTMGMTSIDVGRQLVAAKLYSKSPVTFAKSIENKGLENGLRPGAYIVDSSMSFNQIVSTIFKK